LIVFQFHFNGDYMTDFRSYYDHVWGPIQVYWLFEVGAYLRYAPIFFP